MNRALGRTARWAVLGIVALGLILAAVAAQSAPSHPFVQTKTTHAPVGQTVAASATAAPAAPPSTSKAAPHGTGHLDWITALLAVLAFVLLVMTVWRRRLRLPGGRRRDWWMNRRGEGVVVPAETPPDRPGELADAVDEGLAVIDHGPVADAIIQCWVRVEDAAARAGFDLRPTETSSEFTDRVLVSYGVGGPVLRRMSALYREARFSGHTMSEQSRDDARACLRRISADLDQASATTSATPDTTAGAAP